MKLYRIKKNFAQKANANQGNPAQFKQRCRDIFGAGAIASLAFLGAMSATPAGAVQFTLSSPDQTIHILCSAIDAGCNNYGGAATVADDGTLDSPENGQTLNGAIFTANPNPTEPSTGTGVFNPFLRVQDSGAKKDVDYAGTLDGVYVGNDPETPVNLNTAGIYSSEAGFNTDASKFEDINYQTKPSDGKDASGWTRSVLFGELDTSDGFVTLKLDANEHGPSSSENNLIVITEMQIFVGEGLSNPEISGGGTVCDGDNPPTGGNCFGYTGERFDNADPNNNTLLTETPVWSLDGTSFNGTEYIDNGNVDVVLQASICDMSANANCGSGKGDMEVKIPISYFIAAGALPTHNFVLYFEAIKNHDGFEEWSFASKSGGVDVAEPGTMGIFGIALAGMGYIRRRRRGADA